MAYTNEQRAEARNLYVIDGLSFDQVAEETGINAATLKRWSTEEDWRGSRRKYSEDLRKIAEKKAELQVKLLDEALAKMDPQIIYAFSRVERAAITGRNKEETVEADVDRPKFFLEDLQFVAEVLKEIDPQGLKVFARSFDTIVERGKERFSGAEAA